MYISADCSSQGNTVPFMFSVLPYSTYTVQILYKMYSLRLNCTYSNYTEAAVYVQLHNNTICQADFFWSAVQQTVLNYTCISTYRFIHFVNLDLPNSRFCPEAQCHLFSALQNTPNCSSVWNCMCVYIVTVQPQIRSLKFTLLAARAVSLFDCDKEQVDVTKLSWHVVQTEGNDKYVLYVTKMCVKIFWKISTLLYLTDSAVRFTS